MYLYIIIIILTIIILIIYRSYIVILYNILYSIISNKFLSLSVRDDLCSSLSSRYITYKHKGIYYKLSLNGGIPITQKWNKVITDKNEDVTNIMIEYSGPFKDFFHIDTKISNIIPDCDKLLFYKDDKLIKEFDMFISF